MSVSILDIKQRKEEYCFEILTDTQIRKLKYYYIDLHLIHKTEYFGKDHEFYVSYTFYSPYKDIIFNKRVIIDILNVNFEDKIETFTMLEKYIKYIKNCEGIDYIDPIDHRNMSDVEFTDEEWNILEKISKKLKQAE